MEPNPYEAPAEATPDRAASFDRRWFAAISLVAVVILFASLPLMLTLLALLACNAVAFVALLIARQTTAANLAFLTGVLLGGVPHIHELGLLNAQAANHRFVGLPHPGHHCTIHLDCLSVLAALHPAHRRLTWFLR